MNLKALFVIFISITFSAASIFAQAGYDIKVQLENFSEKKATLAYYYGDKLYVQDTVDVESNGSFTFKGEEALEGGVYMIVLPPDNSLIQIFVSPDEQHFQIKADAKNITGSIKVSGSPDNTLFYTYMEFLGKQLKKKEQIVQDKELAKEDETKLKAIEERMLKLDEEVKTYHSNILKNHPKTMTAAFVGHRVEIEMPAFEGTEEEVGIKRWQYTRKHYFDNLNLGDERLVRTNFLFQRISHYVDKLTVQHPDSISNAIDEVLTKLEPAEGSFKFYLIHFLNTYAGSKIVGMDAVYVHIVDKYYNTGKAPWTDEKQLKKISKNAKTLKPILIGKTAPDIKVEKQDKTPIALHEVKSDFTVLFFWDPDCGHCKKSMPKVIDFYEQYKAKGVEIFAVCTRVTDDVPKCWETIKEKDMGRWINVVDPYLKSRYKQIYDIRTTPQIFILDENKEILSKRIGAEQLGEVLDEMIKIKQLKKAQSEGEK